MKLVLFLFAITFLFPNTAKTDFPERSRSPVAAGAYYPSSAKDLNKLVSESLENAKRRRRFENFRAPKAIIAPAESLFLSAQVMGEAYEPLAKIKPFVRRVVLLGATNPKKYFGTALSDSDFWEIPTGRLAVDKAFNERLKTLSGAEINEKPFLQDYSLELQLPYILKTFGKDVKIVPILIGDTNAEQVADLIDFLWGQTETAVILASNLSDGLNGSDAKKADEKTALKIDLKNANALKRKDVSAFLPVSGFLIFAQNTLMETRRGTVTTTAEFSGNETDVTGMGAWWFYETKQDSEKIKKEREKLIRAHQETLLKLAAKAVKYGFQHGRAMRIKESDYPLELQQNGDIFVRLYHNGSLRGAQGVYDSSHSLLKNIVQGAYAAAFQDFRYIPLEESELSEVEISISFLMPKEQIKFEKETDLIASLRPNIDGLYLKERSNTGLFLPSVWEVYPDPKDFLSHLKQKAGLPADYTSSTLKVSRFEVLDINSGDFETPEDFWK